MGSCQPKSEAVYNFVGMGGPSLRSKILEGDARSGLRWSRRGVTCRLCHTCNTYWCASRITENPARTWEERYSAFAPLDNAESTSFAHSSQRSAGDGRRSGEPEWTTQTLICLQPQKSCYLLGALLYEAPSYHWFWPSFLGSIDNLCQLTGKNHIEFHHTNLELYSYALRSYHTRRPNLRSLWAKEIMAGK